MHGAVFPHTSLLWCFNMLSPSSFCPHRSFSVLSHISPPLCVYDVHLLHVQQLWYNLVPLWCKYVLRKDSWRVASHLKVIQIIRQAADLNLMQCITGLSEDICTYIFYFCAKATINCVAKKRSITKLHLVIWESRSNWEKNLLQHAVNSEASVFVTHSVYFGCHPSAFPFSSSRMQVKGFISLFQTHLQNKIYWFLCRNLPLIVKGKHRTTISPSLV